MLSGAGPVTGTGGEASRCHRQIHKVTKGAIRARPAREPTVTRPQGQRVSSPASRADTTTPARTGAARPRDTPEIAYAGMQAETKPRAITAWRDFLGRHLTSTTCGDLSSIYGHAGT